MSLITQCPACATMFRVVPDQLRISEGWVRCGQCEEVFDANAHLQTLDEAATQVQSPYQPPPPVEQPPAPPAPAAWAPPAASDSSDAYDWGPILQPSPLPSVATSALGELGFQANAPDSAAYPADEPHFDPLAPAPEEAVHSAGSKVDAFLQENPHDLPVSQEPLSVQAEPEPADDWLLQSPQVPLPGAEPSTQDTSWEAEHAPPSFMASASSSSATRWFGKKVLWMLCALLTLTLALQYLVMQRDRVAVTVPALRPALVKVCDWLACRISAPQQIESIAIESSAFTSLKPGVYVLSLSLKNAATMELATPALELTLTDLQDQAVLRRVLLPEEWGGKPQMAASAELSASVPISVGADAVVAKIAGYKLLAFYP